VVRLGGVPVDHAAARAALELVALQAAAMIRSVPNMDAPTRGLDWTVGQTAAHLVAGNRVMAGLAAGSITPEPGVDLTEVNLRRLEQVQERDPAAVADRLVAEARRVLDQTAGRPADDTYPFYGGATVSLAANTAILLGEYLIHGLDIARSVAWPWHIDPDHAWLVIAGATQVLPAYVHRDAARGVTVGYGLHVRGGPRFTFRLADGRPTVEPGVRGPVDCHIGADPVAFLLVSYGREPQWRSILSGKLLSWGRRPWKSLAFKRLLANP
jgi:uncharacterized protein (TIGR03083 family)